MVSLQDCDETAADFYRFDAPNAPWGDYGDILIHGMTNCYELGTDSPELQRTGPFVPPISFPLACVIVTDTVRRELQSSGLTGLAFVPAVKSVIVPVNWHEWDFSDQPPFYPEEGEPESYILGRQHSPELARCMPDLWRLVTMVGADEVRVPEGVHNDNSGQIFVSNASWQGMDFFHADTTLYNYVSARARQWLLDHHPAWVRCKPIQTK